MTLFSYHLAQDRPKQIGLIALQADETIERDFRRLLPDDAELLVSRVPSGDEVSAESLAQMEGHLTGAASLLPRAALLSVVGYGCTSGAAQIGAERIAALVRQGADVGPVTEPLSALIAACRALNIATLAVLSPYVESVSAKLFAALNEQGIEVRVFGSFAEAEEAKVVRIAPQSIAEAAQSLVQGTSVDALFLSCTNLRTLDIIAPLEATTGLPVLASNQVLAWHLLQLAKIVPSSDAPGMLWQKNIKP